MKLIATEDAVGQVLCHDITRIIPGVFKGAEFTKGHIVTEQDIPVLLSMGKEHLYVWEKDESMYHEDEAAQILCSLCINDGMDASLPKEGKIELTARYDGLLKIDTGLLRQVNGFGEMMIASRHSNTPVKKGDKLCGTRIIPLTIKKEKMDQVRQMCGGRKIFTLLPFHKKEVAIVTTGSEVYHGRIRDAFGPVLRGKVEEYGCRVMGQTFCDDRPEQITGAVLDFINRGAGLVLCSGGMSVDPDDRTPLGIKNTGARIVSYGAPVLPGAMFLLAYAGAVPVVGLPGCVMYARRTVFDLVLPRLLADDPVTGEELSRLGEGGLCLNCEVCTWPNCGFGKGW